MFFLKMSIPSNRFSSKPVKKIIIIKKSRLLQEWKCDFLWRDREVEEDRTVAAERVGGGIYE